MREKVRGNGCRGGLAANLARVGSFSGNPAHRDVVESLLEEAKFFIEWTAPDVELGVQAELIELQVLLARWQHAWSRLWTDPLRRTDVADQARAWSRRVLEMSGLLI